MASKKSTVAERPAHADLAGFLTNPENKHLSTAEYVAQGVTHVSDRDLRQLIPRLPGLRERIGQIADSPKLQTRLQLLATYLEETEKGLESSAPARAEVAFALAYFFHSGDRIPDGTPRYGLLDDALIVEAVLERNDSALREHAHRVGREWPERP